MQLHVAQDSMQLLVLLRTVSGFGGALVAQGLTTEGLGQEQLRRNRGLHDLILLFTILTRCRTA